MQKFLSVFNSFFFAPKTRLQDFKFDCQNKLEKNTMGKLATDWLNFAQVGLQLKFAFRIRLFMCNY